MGFRHVVGIEHGPEASLEDHLSAIQGAELRASAARPYSKKQILRSAQNDSLGTLFNKLRRSPAHMSSNSATPKKND
jgi:hypothetical protein